MNTIAVVEDDLDLRLLIRYLFAPDPSFSVAAEISSAEDALDVLRDIGPEVAVIILDNGLAGALSGLQAAPQLKRLAPAAKIILYSAEVCLRREALASPAIDAFILKHESGRLVPAARRLLGLAPTVGSARKGSVRPGQQGVELGRSERFGKEEPLDEVASEAAQEAVLGRGLDAFGDHDQVQRVGEVDDGGHDGRVGRVDTEPGDELPIDLDDVDR